MGINYYIRYCFNNGTYCSSSAHCNSTIISPNGTVLLNNSREGRQGVYFNISIPSSRTSYLGEYIVTRVCYDTGGDINGKASDSYSVLVTPSGFDDDSLGSFILLGFGGLVSLGIIIFGFSKNDPPLVLFGGLAMFVLGLFTLLQGVGNYRNTLTEWGSIITLGIAAYISVRTSMEMINE